MASGSGINTEGDGSSPRRLVLQAAGRVGIPALVLVTLVACVIWFFAGPQESAPDQIARLRSGVADLLLFSAAMGVVGMTFVEMGKRMLLVRGAYHESCVRDVFGPHVLAALVDPLGYGSLEHDEDNAGQRSAWLDRESERRRLDIPLEQLSAQVGDVAEALLARLARAPLRTATGAGDRPSRDVAMTVELCGPLGLTLLERLDGHWTEESADRAVTELRTVVLASLDRFQVVVGGRWRTSVQLAAASTTALLTVPAVGLMEVGPATKTVATCLAFVVGGVVSWVARDVMALLERLRER